MRQLLDALPFAQSPDPGDDLDYGFDVGALLETGESVDPTTIIVTLDDDAAALGLIVASTAPRQPQMADDGQTIVFWLSVDPTRRSDAAFDRFGVEVAVTVDFWTTATPARRYERSAIVEMRNR